jgi:hypothetical protein
MTKHHATEIARREIGRLIEKRGKYVREKARNRAVRVRANSIMRSTKVVQLSEKFDAPQFAEQFRDIAAKSESRNLQIKAQSRYEDKVTKRPKLEWLDEGDWRKQVQVIRAVLRESVVDLEEHLYGAGS